AAAAPARHAAARPPYPRHDAGDELSHVLPLPEALGRGAGLIEPGPVGPVEYPSHLSSTASLPWPTTETTHPSRTRTRTTAAATRTRVSTGTRSWGARSRNATCRAAEEAPAAGAADRSRTGEPPSV